MRTRWVLSAILFCALWLGGMHSLSLGREYKQFQTLNGYFDLTYTEMIAITGPPDVDDPVKGITEWWSLEKEDVAFGLWYPDGENRSRPSSLSIYFRTVDGHRRCFLDQRDTAGFVEFALFYWFRCIQVIKTPEEIAQRDKRYRESLARIERLSAGPAAVANGQ